MNRPAKKTLNFLHHKCKYSQKTGRKIMWAYGRLKGIENKTEQDFITLGHTIQNDWDAFMKWFGSLPKGLYSKATGHPKNPNNHNNYIHTKR